MDAVRRSCAILVVMFLAASLRAQPAKQATLNHAKSLLADETQAIDLPSALRLAGIQNTDIQLAQERITASLAVRQLAAAQWLPNLNAGASLNHHIGALQQANGNFIDVHRDSMSVGFGTNAVGGGTITIPGLVWNANLSNVIHRNLVSRPFVAQSRHAGEAAENQVLLQVASAYLEILRAEGRLASARKTRQDAHEVARITSNFAKIGQGRQADADRAVAEYELRNIEVLSSEQEIASASARLCQLLSLDPSTRLKPVEPVVVPQGLVPEAIPLPELIATALLQRPELKERRAAVRAALLEASNAKWLPFSPNVIVGFSAGTFGGGSDLVAKTGGDRFGNFGDRQDLDVVLYWTARNLGVGNIALTKIATSQHRAAHWREIETMDRIRYEVAVAQSRAAARLAQIDAAEKAVAASTKSLSEDLLRAKNREGLPIEMTNSVRLLGRGRFAYVDAIIEYNRAQFELYVALGKPPLK